MKIHSPSFNAQGALTRTRGVDHRFLPLKTCQKQCNLRCWRFQRWIWTPSLTDQLYLLGFGIRLKTHVKMCIYTHIYIYIYALLDMLWEPDRKGRKDVRLYVRRSGAGPTERHNGGTKDTRAAPKRGRSRREDTRETTGQGEISRLLRVNWKKCLCKVKKLRF